MSVIILADVFRCADPYSYGAPEHYMAKKYTTEEQVAELHKFCKRELKKTSYWFIRLTRVDADSEHVVTTEHIVHKNKLKTKIQLNTAAKPSVAKIPKYPPSVSTVSMPAGFFATMVNSSATAVMLNNAAASPSTDQYYIS